MTRRGSITDALEASDDPMAAPNWLRWKVGHHDPRLIYAVVPPGASPASDKRLGRMNTPQLAEEVVNAHNAVLASVDDGGGTMNYNGPGTYRHYKGGEYEVLGLALQENTVTKQEPDGSFNQIGEGHDEVVFVMYRPITPGSMLEDRQEDFWARELSDFNASVREGFETVPRFQKIDSRFVAANDRARRVADKWNELDPPTSIPPDAVRQITDTVLKPDRPNTWRRDG